MEAQREQNQQMEGKIWGLSMKYKGIMGSLARWRILVLMSCLVALLLGGPIQAVGVVSATADAKGDFTGEGSGTPSPDAVPPRPVLAFYYTWYHQSDWSLQKMSDLPTIKYTSSDDATIDRQLKWAVHAGLTGFISSWWGQGDQTDRNFGKLLSHAAALEQHTHMHFASSLYFECDSPRLSSSDQIVKALLYIKARYTNDPHFFHWQGKPVLFFWKELDQGRTLDQWAAIRQQVDPDDEMIWSAEGVDLKMLKVFDGIHLFSAGYWGLVNGAMPAVDQAYSRAIAAYNKQHKTHKIWAAGVEPGYDDTRVAGRFFTYRLLRNNGAIYKTSWEAAIASRPDWVTITSFNEWFEGAQIEPSVTYGTSYLNLTHQWICQWRTCHQDENK
jgi:hypothetical protein